MARILYVSILIFLGVLLFFAFYLSIYHLQLEISFIKNVGLVTFSIILLLLTSWGIKLTNSDQKIFLISVISIAFLIRIVFVLINDTAPVSDFAFIYSTAVKINKHDFSMLHSKYYTNYIYNVPFTLYQALLLKVFNSITFLKVFNVIFSTATVYVIYLVGKNFNVLTAKIAMFLVAVFPPMIIYIDVLTNQTISIFFLTLGIYFLFQKSKYNFLLCGIYIGIGHIMRPVGSIFLIGILSYIIFRFLQNQNYSFKSFKNLVIKIVTLIVCFHSVILITSGAILLSNSSSHTLYYNPAPSYKFLVGLNHHTKGRYSNDDVKLLRTEKNFEKVAKQKIKERASDKDKLMALFKTKFELFWSGIDASQFWAGINDHNKLKTIIALFWSAILFFSIIPCFSSLKNQKYDIFFFAITLLGFIAIYLIIEIQTRYRYEIYPLVILLSSLGLYDILKRITGINKNTDNE